MLYPDYSDFEFEQNCFKCYKRGKKNDGYKSSDSKHFELFFSKFL